MKILLWGLESRGLGNGSPPAGSRGGAPVGFWERSPHKLKYNVKFSALKNENSFNNTFLSCFIIHIECNIKVGLQQAWTVAVICRSASIIA